MQSVCDPHGIGGTAAWHKVLAPSFYHRDPVTVARELLGKLLVRSLDGDFMIGRVVETEAYLAADDPANHAFRGRTGRNAVMFGPPGHAYVYAIHRYHCLNVVTEGEGVPSAVLIRAVEPLSGLDRMQRQRPTGRLTTLTSGPGRLCQALAIDRTLNGWDVTRAQRLWFVAPACSASVTITVTARIGVTSARQLPLRFCLGMSPFVSRGPYARR
jgi:DNA-3-methyladenine glycosylase